MSLPEPFPGVVTVVPKSEAGSAWQSPNLYLIGHDELTLIDAGYDRDSTVDPVMEALAGRKLERIVLTHGHIDHAGGAWKLRERTGARVLAHGAEGPAIGRRFPGRSPDGEIADGEVIAAGPHRLRAILTPGHARGHLCLLLEGQGVLFSGDLVTGDGSTLVAPPEGDMKTYMESLRAVQSLDLKLILPGHGPVVTDPAARVAALIEHRELRELCIARCLSEGGAMNLKDLTRAMYLGLIHPQLELAAAGTAWAHLAKLIDEGAVISGPDGETNPFNLIFQLAPGVKPPF